MVFPLLYFEYIMVQVTRIITEINAGDMLKFYLCSDICKMPSLSKKNKVTNKVKYGGLCVVFFIFSQPPSV